MKKFYLLMLVAVSVFTLCGNEVKVREFSLIPENDGKFILHKPGTEKVNGYFFLKNGKTEKPEKLKGKVKNNTQFISAADCSVKINYVPRNRMILAETTISNTSNKEIWIEPGLILDLPHTGKEYFFSGVESRKTENKIIARNGLKAKPEKHTGAFASPLSLTILIAPEHSWSLGNIMFELTSYNAARFIPQGNRCQLEYSRRLVLAPGRKAEFSFVIGATQTLFGKEEAAIQAFYDSFPETWIPAVGYDNKYIWNAHAMYAVWHYKPDYETERRFHSRWDWAYAPYKRCGDIYGRKELWDYKPLGHPFKPVYAWRFGGEFFDYRTLSCEEFHKKRKKIFDKYGKKFGYAFYADASGTFCELQLAREKYPDAINTDRDDGTVFIFPSWSTSHDNEVRVFPYKTTFAKQLYQDAKDVHKELGLPGFSLDCCGGGAKYRGPASKDPDMPFRAYDQKGIYVDQGIAVNKFIDFLHNDIVPNGDYRTKPFLAGNGSLKCDVQMMEKSVFDPVFDTMMPLWRYIFGSLPGIIHGKGYFINQLIPEWRQLNTNEFLERFTTLAVYSVFQEFRYGLTSSRSIYKGNALGQYCMPELLECIKYGWQVQVPVNCDNGGKILYKSRYSRGENTILFFGNPYRETVKTKFGTVNELLGSGQYIFNRKMRDCANLKQTLRNGETVFSSELESRYPVLFEAVCGLSNVPADGITAEVASVKDLHKIRNEVKITSKQPFTAAVQPRMIFDFLPAQITLNGKKIKAGEKVHFTENSTLVMEYSSKDFSVGSNEITEFPFLNEQFEPSFSIRLTENSAAEREQAQNIQEYFSFCAKNNLCNPRKITVKNGKDSVSGAEIVLNFSADKNIVAREGNKLIVYASDAYNGEELVRKLSFAMDKRFEHFFGLMPDDGMPGDLLNKLAVRGKYVPVRMKKCFENGGNK